MVARRGRCHQVTYKPRITTLSEDEFESEFLIEKPDKINRLLQYGLDQSKQQKENFAHPVDRHLQALKDTVNDLETRVYKRTKKHTYKMDVTYHPQVKYESKNEELAAKLGQPDPVLTRHFKRSHAFTYQEHMGLEADRALFRVGCLP